MSMGVGLVGTLTGYLSHLFLGSPDVAPNTENAMATDENTVPNAGSADESPADTVISRERIAELMSLLAKQQK